MTMDELAGMSAWDWPPEAGAKILAVLEDPTAPLSERELAAELAGDLIVMNDSLAEALLSILQDESESEFLRGQAAISFGAALEEADIEGYAERNEPAVDGALLEEAKEALRSLFEDRRAPKEVRRRALEASVRAFAPWHTSAIRAAYNNADPEWNLTAVFCMRFVRGFDREVVEALDSENPGLVYQAVLAAGEQVVPGAWFRVRAMVIAAAEGRVVLPDDPEGEWSLLMAAMHAVAVIRPHEATRILGWFTESEDQELANAAHEALDIAQGLAAEGDDPWGEEPTWH
jgi:hypothetical protein